jgi:hypothetical protein
MANTEDDKPKLALVDDSFDDSEDEYGDSEYEYDQACKAQQKKNDAYLDEFDAYLEKAGLADKTIGKHLQNVGFFVNTFLVYDAFEEPVDAADGWKYVDDFLGYFFIRKCMWSTPNSIKQNITSFKKFYACMLENGHLSKSDYDELLLTIKDNKDAWLEDCQDFNTPSDDYFGGSFDQELFNSVYNDIARGLGLDGVLGVPPADFEDDPYDEEDLFTKEEAIGMLAMALLYLTSWEEKGPNGQSTLRARKSIDPKVMEQLRDMGFISYDNNAQSVVMTKLGETMGKESVVTLGFDYLLDNLQLVD